MQCTHELTVFNLCCGIGGFAKGAERGVARVGPLTARYRSIGGVDVDPGAVRCYKKLVRGRHATVLDLFSREQYVAFHGKQPPKGWREATAEDLRQAAGGEDPDVVKTSPPCKGLSGLLSAKASASAKYQALNQLVIRSVMLALEAWKHNLPSYFVLENVPRIAQRGRKLLDHLQALFRNAGYVFHESTHDCGELGGLAQHRRRFLLIARLPAKVPSFCYEPPKRRVRAISEVIGPLPMPDDPRGGPMHRLPRLEWNTWVRLSLIPAGGDWRDLPGSAPKDKAARKAWEQRGEKTAGEQHLFKGKFGMQGFALPARTVIGGPSNGCAYVADPRASPWNHPQWYGVLRPDEPARTVTGQSAVGGGAYAYPDPRWGGGRLGVLSFGGPSGTVTGEAYPSTGPFSFGDPRWFGDVLGVRSMDGPLGTVTAQAHATRGAFNLADGRIGDRFNNVERPIAWDQPAVCVTAATGNTRSVVADPRIALTHGRQGRHSSHYKVRAMDEAAGCVTADTDIQTGAPCVADARVKLSYHNLCRILREQSASTTVTGATRPAGGAQCIADSRMGDHYGKLRVEDAEAPAHTVTGSDRVGSGAPSVTEKRGWKAGKGTSHYGVMDDRQPAGAVTAACGPDNGRGSITDRRPVPRYPYLFRVFRWDVYAGFPWEMPAMGAPMVQVHHIVPWALWVRPAPDGAWVPPEDVPVIIALDGTWHRPITTWELAALQDLDVLDAKGQPLVLEGVSHSQWREWIGNLVPPGAGEAIAVAIAESVLRSRLGIMFAASGTPVWVEEREEALAADPAEAA